MKIKQSC